MLNLSEKGDYNSNLARIKQSQDRFRCVCSVALYSTAEVKTKVNHIQEGIARKCFYIYFMMMIIASNSPARKGKKEGGGEGGIWRSLLGRRRGMLTTGE